MKKHSNPVTPSLLDAITVTPANVTTTTTTTTEERKEVPTMKNTTTAAAAKKPAAVTITPAPITAAANVTPTEYGRALINLRAEGGAHTITAKAADALLSLSIDEYRKPFFDVRAAAVDLYNVPTDAAPAARAAAEDKLSAALRTVYARAAEDLLPERDEMRYAILALNTLRKAKDKETTPGVFEKGTRDFRPVSDVSYVKAIENLIATRLTGAKWDAELNTFRAPTQEEAERMEARIKRYHEKKNAKKDATKKPAPAKKEAPAKDAKKPAAPAKGKKPTTAKKPAKEAPAKKEAPAA